MAGSRREIAYKTIKTEILDGTLKMGDIISERTYTERLLCSRTPVHEAVTQLAEEGLVKIMPSRGMVVAPIAVGDITMVYQVRFMLEPAIARALAAQPLPDFEGMLSEAMDKEEGDGDSAFHCALAALTGNSYLVEIERRLLTQCQRIRMLSTREDEKRNELAMAEHQAIRNAIKDRDGELAAKEVLHHLRRTLDDYQHLFSLSRAISL